VVARPSVVALIAAILTGAAPGCLGGSSSPPTTLSDGSAARPPPVELEGVDVPIVATAVRVARADAVATQVRSASCVRTVGARVGSLVVERVGVSGTSVTFVEPRRRAAFACDSLGGSPGEATWCGFAYGRLVAGRLRDARLSLSCEDDGHQLGFLWIQPGVDTSYVVAHGSRYAEAYSVVPGVPVRVTTAEVDTATSSATLTISEHARDGRQLRTYMVEAQVAD
jgi:hypothetical protein